ncbi:MAG: hypothetical protein V3U64_05290 [Cocleimonas sp.]
MKLVFDVESVDLPSWARWIAQDADGAWWAYEVEPLQFHKGWYENEVGRNKRLSYKHIVENWEESLFKVQSRS